MTTEIFLANLIIFLSDIEKKMKMGVLIETPSKMYFS